MQSPKPVDFISRLRGFHDIISKPCGFITTQVGFVFHAFCISACVVLSFPFFAKTCSDFGETFPIFGKNRLRFWDKVAPIL